MKIPHLSRVVFVLCTSVLPVFAGAAEVVLWQDDGSGSAQNGVFVSKANGVQAGGSITQIADPTGSGRGIVTDVNLSGVGTGTEYGAILVETSPFGTFPSTAINGPDDVGFGGRILPTTSTDIFFAEMAEWFGVPPTEMGTLLPNLQYFDPTLLGYLNT